MSTYTAGGQAAAGLPLSARRLLIVGTSGAGKSTLARCLAQHYGLRHIELDALYWQPGWTEITYEVLRPKLKQLLDESEGGWVIDGNYSRLSDLTWPQADTLVWLDYPLPLILYRLTHRTFRRVFRQEELWNGNRERLKNIFSKDSILWFALTTYRRRRLEMAERLSRPEYAHLKVLRFRSPGAARCWLDSLAA